MERKRMRDEIRKLRRAVPHEQRIQSSSAICQRFRTLPAFQSATNVAGFLAFDGEADPLELMTTASNMGKQVFVPVIIGKRQPLRFTPWSPDIPMQKNSFGIEEPAVPREKWIGAEQLDFVIHPLVAFDKHCVRLGVGGGYYDRSFAHLNSLTASEQRSTSLVGFAFELQRVPSIVRQPWDVVLDAVVTEWNIYSA